MNASRREPRGISSAANPRIKQLIRLRTKRGRDRTGLFVVEGVLELSRAVQHRIPIVEIYVCPPLLTGADGPALLRVAAASGIPLFEVDDAPFRKAAYREGPEGLIGLARRFRTGLDQIDPEGEPLLLVIESIEKPGNLGTMLRTADAAGARGVVVCDPATDVFNPNVVRASLGALFTVPVAVTSTVEALDWLDGHQIRSVVTSPAATLPYSEADFRGACAIVVGSEHLGVSSPWLEAATTAIRIPMLGAVDSLNAATAAGIVLFEAVRQRGVPPS